MAIAGAVLLMARYKAINLKFAENWEEEYQRSSPMDKRSTPQSGIVDQVGEKPADEMVEEEQPVEEVKISRAKKAIKSQSILQKKAKEKIAARKAKESSTRTVREKKIS